MHLHKFILENIEAILQEWEKFAKTLPPAKEMNTDQLRNHAKSMIQKIASDMRKQQSRGEQENKSKGHQEEAKETKLESQTHAQHRFQEGFDLNQIVAEYRALRASVIRLWMREPESKEPQIQHLVRFNEAMDQALTEAIKQYADEAEKNHNLYLDQRESNERKDEFLAMLAHELRNPLAPLQTGVEIFSLSESFPENLQDSLSMMKRQMNHLVHLIDDLLDISRITQDKLVLRKEELDIQEIVGKAIETTHSFLSDDKRQLSVKYPLERILIYSDPVRLVQMISNLISNAVKFTGDNGMIWVEVSREENRVKISVKDNGKGMSQQIQEHIFDMYSQEDSINVPGLGIGLALVRVLTELHGGTITAFSEGPGKGSEFSLYLPVIEKDLPHKPKQHKTPRLQLQGQKIMVVDDNEDAAESLNSLLSMLGANVTAVNDGASALNTYDEFQPSTILLDLGMDAMNGFEVADAIRRKPGGSNVKIVAVTGWGQDEDLRKTAQHGFNGHLVKPISLKDLEMLQKKVY